MKTAGVSSPTTHWLAGMLVAFTAAIPFGDFSQPGHVFYFVAAMLLANVCYFCALRTYPFHTPATRIKMFWSATILFRVIALFFPAGDDIHRYLWEGRIQWQGINPYLLAPDSPSLTHLLDASWSLINHAEWPAIYPPGAELILKLLTVLRPSQIAIKLACLFADLCVVYLLLRVNTGQARYRDTAWYAWNPLVIYSFAGAGHFDSWMLAPLLLSIYALHRGNPLGRKPTHWGWASVATFSLGVAISIKLVPLIFIPVIALALGSRFVVLPLALLPLGMSSLAFGFPKTPIFDSFRAFNYVSRFNDFVWWISERFLWNNPTQKNGWYNLIGVGVISAVSLLAWFRWRDWRRALLWAMGTCLVFSTVVHPWYVTWILPFAVMRRAHGWFVLSATIFLAFLWWESTPWWSAWQPSPLLSLSICLPPLLFFIYVTLQSRPHDVEGNLTSEPKLQS